MRKEATNLPPTTRTFARMDPSLLVAFLVVDLLIVFTPGADWGYAISAGVRGRTVAPAIAGLAGGHLLHATLVVIGVGGLLAQSNSAMQALTYAGAAYLLWLGIGVVRDPAPLAPGGTDSASALRGLATSVLNPKCPVLFFALLPQFVAHSAPWSMTAQLAVLAAFHVAACAVVYLGVALAARRLLRSRPGAARIVSRVSGIAMIAVAAGLVIEHAAAA
jgi:threonine/homoserine/homoserine lactone efflux protein